MSARAEAASYANRSLNLPSGMFELGLGAGLGHREPGSYTGVGLNLELGYGLTSTVELRVRTGIRFGQNGQIVDADKYGRPVESETYFMGSDALANPEVGLRFNLVRGGSAEIAFDTRLYLPFSGRMALMLGVPLALRLGQRVRFDTGLYLPIGFYENDTRIDLSIPLHLWIKLDGGTFVGPMTGIYKYDGGGSRVPFGVGLGTPLAYDADLRFWVLFEDIDAGSNAFGAGVGLYVNF